MVGEGVAAGAARKQVLRAVGVAVRADAGEVAAIVVAQARARRGRVLVQAVGRVAVGAVGGIGPAIGGVRTRRLRDLRGRVVGEPQRQVVRRAAKVLRQRQIGRAHV